MQGPTLAPTRLKIKNNCKYNTSTQKTTISQDKNIHMVEPYIRGLSEILKTIVEKWESKFILKGETPSKTSLWSKGQGHYHTEKLE